MSTKFPTKNKRINFQAIKKGLVGWFLETVISKLQTWPSFSPALSSNFVGHLREGLEKKGTEIATQTQSFKV